MSALAIKLSSATEEAAREAARVNHRSIAGQLEHWATIGRAIESSGRFSSERVQEFLAGEIDYDALAGEEQVMALATLEAELTAEFSAADADSLQAELLADAQHIVGTDDRLPVKIVRKYRDGRIEIEGDE